MARGVDETVDREMALHVIAGVQAKAGETFLVPCKQLRKSTWRRDTNMF